MSVIKKMSNIFKTEVKTKREDKIIGLLKIKMPDINILKSSQKHELEFLATKSQNKIYEMSELYVNIYNLDKKVDDYHNMNINEKNRLKSLNRILGAVHIINFLTVDIYDLLLSLDESDNLSDDTKHKMNELKDKKLQQLWHLVEIDLEMNYDLNVKSYTQFNLNNIDINENNNADGINKNSDMNKCNYESNENARYDKRVNVDILSVQLAVNQTPKKQFLACNMSLSNFEDFNPIKVAFCEALTSQSLCEIETFPYTFILNRFKDNLENAILINGKNIDQFDINTSVEHDLRDIIKEFISEQNIYLSFRNIHQSILNLTNKEYVEIEDTMEIYHQLSIIGVEYPLFIFKMLTTCEGLNINEQFKFINITHFKTTIFAFFNSFY